MVPLFEDNDRVDRAFKQCPFPWRNECELVDMVRPHHDRKGLLDPAEAVLERIRRLFDACEMETADPPHGEDEPGIEQPCCLFHRILTFNGITELVLQGESGTTACARYRLGVMAPGVRVTVLP